jgi:hypothetical protein
LLRNLPLFNAMNGKLNPPVRLPKPLQNHGKRVAMKGGKVVTCSLFEAPFTKLADDQFLTALAWGIAALQDADDPRTRAKEQGCSPRPTQDKT